MVEMREITKHVAGDIEMILDLVKHIKDHIEKALEIYNFKGDKELGEIGKHLLEIDAKVHELYYHITKKEVQYNPYKDLSVEKEK